MRAAALLIPLSLAVLALAAPAQAIPDSQPAKGATGAALRVFLDCRDPRYCDADFFRTELPFVDHVRDPQVAQVHVLVTTQGTGGGGTQFDVRMIGLGAFGGLTDSLSYASRPADPPDAVRRALARVFKLGLVRYLARTPAAELLQVSYAAPAEQQATHPASSTRDPWDYWVITLRGNGDFNGEKSSKSTNVFGTLSANRTTAALKINLSLNAQYGQSAFELSEGTFRNYTHGFGGNVLVVKSIDDHWSAGTTASANSSTFLNQNAAYRVAPAIEYDIFPYSQSTRRQLALRYSIGASTVDYAERTIYNRFSETLYDQNLVLELDVRQPWGSANASVEGGHYLHDISRYHASLFGGGNVRLFKGLSLNLFASLQSLHDQLYLSSFGVTDEQALLRARQQATNYRYSSFVGLSYTFGSIYNNVVNPRFGGSGGGVFFMF